MSVLSLSRAMQRGSSRQCGGDFPSAVSGGGNQTATMQSKFYFSFTFATKFSYCLDEGASGAGVTLLATHSRDLFGHNLIQLAHYFISSRSPSSSMQTMLLLPLLPNSTHCCWKICAIYLQYCNICKMAVAARRINLCISILILPF